MKDRKAILIDYVVENAARLLEEPDKSLIRDSLDAELLENFLNAFQPETLIVFQYADKDGTRYKLLDSIPQMEEQDLAVMFTKKRSYFITDSPLSRQIFVAMIGGSDSREAFHSRIEKLFTSHSEAASSTQSLELERLKLFAKPTQDEVRDVEMSEEVRDEVRDVEMTEEVQDTEMPEEVRDEVRDAEMSEEVQDDSISDDDIIILGDSKQSDDSMKRLFGGIEKLEDTEKKKSSKFDQSELPKKKCKIDFGEYAELQEDVSFISDESLIEADPTTDSMAMLQPTNSAQQEERERVERLAVKKRKFNGIVSEIAPDGTRKLTQLILDNSQQPHVTVHRSLVRRLKPHQAEGIQFMYDCTIESLDRLHLPGGGGILAHCMGLGKTFQTIAFIHTLLSHPVISKTIRRVLIVVPKNVIINWQNEFEKWIFGSGSMLPDFTVCELDTLKENKARLGRLKTWFTSKKSTVCIIGYEMFRNLTQDYTKPNKKTGKVPADAPAKKKLVVMQPEFRKYLQVPGPDLTIFDEGHKLKNVESEISKTVAMLQTKRRICLTGTPVQNSLIEYYCMVNFVKGNLLGDIKEFKQRFENPIKAGQTKDSDAYDVKIMRRRCHVLYEKLKGIIDRKDFNILADNLLPKYEYVIQLRSTEKQVKLYRYYLDQECSDKKVRGKNLLSNYYVFSRISTHPFQVVVQDEEKEVKDNKKAKKKADEDSDDDDSDEEGTGETFTVPNPPTKAWFKNAKILSAEDRDDYTMSYKLMFLVEIIKQCETVGDKVLVFSQSLEALRLIKRMLESLASTWFDDYHEAQEMGPNERWGWQLNKDYMVVDGSVSSKARDLVQKQFNDQENQRTRLCLISTKAGSLGTNFVGANRVVIFDQNWNPSHDRQALFRAYRFGQTKPVYIYRLVAHGTIEDRVYARQVTKESISGRVVDEHQIQSHFLTADLEALYQLDIDEYDASKAPLYLVPEDELLANVFVALKEGIVNCLQHDSLLAHHEEEMLSPEEMKEAWDEFEKRQDSKPKQTRKKVAKEIAGPMNAPMKDSSFNSLLEDLMNSGGNPGIIREVIGHERAVKESHFELY